MFEIDPGKLAQEIDRGTPVELLSGNRLPQMSPSTVVGGTASTGLITTSALSQILGAITFGTAPASLRGTEPSEVANIAITADMLIPSAAAPADRTFAELRRRIEETGIPLLDDEELRQEIRDRRGSRP